MKRYWFYTITSFVIRFKTSPLSSHFNIHPSSGKCTLFFIAEPLFNFIVLRHTRKAYNCKRKIWDVLIPLACLTFSANNNIQIIKVTRWEIVKNQNKEEDIRPLNGNRVNEWVKLQMKEKRRNWRWWQSSTERKFLKEMKNTRKKSF